MRLEATVKPNPELRLFCFPHAGGGNSSTFQNWSTMLPATIEVCWVELPGRLGRFKEPAVKEMSRLAPTLAQELRESLDLRFALFGHSMGALVAFEVARELRRTNAPQPMHLFVSAQPAPQLPRTRSFLHLLPDELFLTQVMNQMPLVAAGNPELMKLMLPTLRADIALSETYRYGVERPLDFPITAMGGNMDFLVSHAQLDAWRFQTIREFNLHLFPGNHAYFQTATRLLLQTIHTELSSHKKAQKTQNE